MYDIRKEKQIKYKQTVPLSICLYTQDDKPF